jgi:hypothetical protein
MFVTVSLLVSVVTPVIVVMAALLTAPEAYENERGLQIVERAALAKKFSLAQEPAALESATSA